MKNEKKTMITYSILGILAGVISFYVKNNIYALATMIAILCIGYYAMKKIFKIEEKMKWFMTNGGWVYIFIWFVFWVMIINVV